MAVTKTNNLRLGSKGDDVLDLQKRLNSAGGYNLAEDGSFGSKTLAAVKDYQAKNNLTVDGIVGTNTWGKLTSSGAATAMTPTSTSTTSTSTPTTGSTGTGYEPYQKSDTVAQAEAMLQQQMANKPGEYQSAWQSQLDEILNKILNREEFSYDLNGDALYQQYKDQYMLQGQKAMMDTMGQAAALTGGYGNSYAQSVGQQAYQGYLQQLNDKVPELYQLALSKYQMDGDALLDQYSMIGAREDQDYARYQDDLAAYYTELDRLTDSYRDQRDYDYGKYADERDFAYGQERDQAADEKWQAEFDEAKRQYDQEWEQKYGSSSGGSTGGNGGSGGSGGGGGGGGYDNGGYDTATIKKAQAFVGASADGYWGKNSSAAAVAAGYDSLEAVIEAMNGGGGGEKLTYSDVAKTAEQMRQNGATPSDIAAYLSAIVYGDNYIPTTNPNQDMMELRAGFVGSGR